MKGSPVVDLGRICSSRGLPASSNLLELRHVRAGHRRAVELDGLNDGRVGLALVRLHEDGDGRHALRARARRRPRVRRPRARVLSLGRVPTRLELDELQLGPRVAREVARRQLEVLRRLRRGAEAISGWHARTSARARALSPPAQSRVAPPPGDSQARDPLARGTASSTGTVRQLPHTAVTCASRPGRLLLYWPSSLPLNPSNTYPLSSVTPSLTQVVGALL